ncbi:transglycosylase SLT domain-containing protein [Synechococcus sp. W65.1]|uniref:lytic transglycosylase domain-containing protein n=1 Tax=Synechococcus sp. W65.1 TaxID=2964526 RepID=UPI0039C23296
MSNRGRWRRWVVGALAAGGALSGALWGFYTWAEPVEMAAVPPAPLSSTAGAAFLRAYRALQAGQAQAALEDLQGLEEKLPVLTDEIWKLRAQAYEKLGDRETAQRVWWPKILQEYPHSPVAAYALWGIGQVEQLRQQFPTHPLTARALKHLLEQDPNHYDLLRDLAQHHPQTPGLTPLLDRWRQAQEGSLTASDWQILADAYWEQREYGKAARAYRYAPATPQNLYRWGRSHQISGEFPQARAAYQALLAQFPNAAEASLTRRRLAELSDLPTAIQLLRQVGSGSDPEAPEALLSLSQLHERNNSPQLAQAVRQALWERFPASEAAANAAWTVAWRQAQAGNLRAAIAVAQQIGLAQRDTEMGAQLLYWAGKWRERLGDMAAARQTYQQVLQRFPRTYYGWRAAAQLGWPVGDFSSGRQRVEVDFQPVRQPLPAVSEATQALHLLGASQMAWERWQGEMALQKRDAGQMSVAERFASGILRNNAGEHLRGINQVAALRFSTEADPLLESLRQRQDFWQALYPLHYYASPENRWERDPHAQPGLAHWAQQFNLNPLMVAALIRQESRFEPEIVSASGALGLMQVMPATGRWIAQKIGLAQYSLTNPADNLRLGSWYFDYTHRAYQDNTLLALASYNGGPGNVAKWLSQFGFEDPDEFVEQIPFAETRGYVKAVFGNYWNYWQLYTREGRTLASALQLEARPVPGRGQPLPQQLHRVGRQPQAYHDKHEGN